MENTQNNDVFSLRYFELRNKLNDTDYINSLNETEIKNLKIIARAKREDAEGIHQHCDET